MNITVYRHTSFKLLIKSTHVQNVFPLVISYPKKWPISNLSFIICHFKYSRISYNGESSKAFKRASNCSESVKFIFNIVPNSVLICFETLVRFLNLCYSQAQCRYMVKVSDYSYSYVEMNLNTVTYLGICTDMAALVAPLYVRLWNRSEHQIKPINNSLNI